MDDEGSNGTDHLPDDLLAAVRTLDEQQLRSLIDFTQRRLQEVHPAISDQIDKDSHQEIVQIEEGEGVAKVLRHEPLEDDQDVPVLYLVTEELTPEGETRLHWTYLGPIQG
ncbi:hypothetical protein HUG10_07570 [Halorarum halophilum]|uniref:Uncharacterized protein n=1 Tax=Halorarum halophilum TaxID=2743090 RepID=A0A7D5KLC7_9EURY|nr:hypothetical protein [Halobaculum halophilum]QLG27415.1 hypothetical protein HUG10_07570 [Halobaculum halophilum]